jgi:DNA-binding LacI/PurR family transcriptional regulator
MGNTVSIKDLARKFKCAPSTISRALNDHPMINIDTRKTIQEYANKVGYQKNTISLSLVFKTKRWILIIFKLLMKSWQGFPCQLFFFIAKWYCILITPAFFYN